MAVPPFQDFVLPFLRQKKLVLIDGEKLTELMVDFGVGLNKVASYTVQKIDPDYFGEE